MEPSEPSCSTSCAISDAENQAEGSVPEPLKDAETQTEEFAYMFYRPTYQAPDREVQTSTIGIIIITVMKVPQGILLTTRTEDPNPEII